ncbi:MAG: YbjQ family protein [Pseudomonadota bacterium]
MIVTMTENVPGHQITQVIGTVKGNTVRTRFFGRDIIAGLRNLVGGEVPEYTKLMAEAREQALDRMIASAQAEGADAVVNMRVTTSMIMGGSAELLAYGTAVRLTRSDSL